MRWKLRFKDCFIIALCIFLLASLLVIDSNKVLTKDFDYDLKIEAAKGMEASLKEIRNEKIKRGIEIDTRYDINDTGIIGVEFNGLTTTLGSLESKRTSANPNFAAVLVDLLKEAGLEAGDSLALNLSSSFPGLNIATIVACDVLDLKPVIISSIGASTWGGNNIEFTYLDMEDHLYGKGFIGSKSIAISPGGYKDIGMDMDQDILAEVIDRMDGYGKEIIIEEDLLKNINLRYDLYNTYSDDIKCFVNVGGNIISFGDTGDSLITPVGLVKGMDYKISDKSGLVQRFYSEDVPIIHLLNIKDLSHRYGMELDSDTGYVVGEGNVYYRYSYPYKMIVLILIITFISLIIYRKRIRDLDD